jgi:regulator of sigma E protease
MIIDWIAAALPLAASDDLGFFGSLLSQVMVWGRVAIGIGFVIFVHELGHFVAAKTFGVKCEKFYVGFDVPLRIGPIKFPRTLGKFQYGETEYGIGILPLGGYVKMLGQDDDPRKQEEEAKRIRVDEGGEDEPEKLDPRSYPAKPVWQRMVIISSGVVMNVITGVLFAAIAFGYGVAYNPAIIGGVSPGGPAWQAGIKPGGEVVAVGRLTQDRMHFRQMREAILTEGLDNPDKPIDISIRYDDGIRDYKLRTAPHPENEDVRMIGITSPTSVTFGKEEYAAPGSVAELALDPADAGASVVSFDGTPIDESSIVPGTPLFDYLYSNPTKTISLGIRRADGSTHEVELPPQPAKSIGLRYAIGPIEALVVGGPAVQAGIQVGDVITAVDGDDTIDAFGLPLTLAGAKSDVKLTLRRGEGADAETVEVVVSPIASPQTLPPTSGMSGQVAVNVLGLAYRPKAEIARVIVSPVPDAQGEPLLPGYELTEIKLAWNKDDIPESLRDERYEWHLEKLIDGWVFANATPLNSFRKAIQLLPEGAELRVWAKRPSDGRVVEGTVVVGKDDRVNFERGLGFTASESIQTASSFSEAMALGVREGQYRFFEVLRFLGMLTRGKVKLEHVGGPLEIVNMAKKETERGISRQLMFLTMLSMNLAILNFLPIPALDGGHMVFLLYELVRGKRADEQIEFRLTLAGVIALLTLMVVVFANDIMRHL